MNANVLVTGSAGRIGRAAVAALVAAGHRVTGFDRRPTPGLPADQSRVGLIEDVAAVHEAARHADLLIHLAAAPDDAVYPRGESPNDGDNFLSELVPANIVGTYAVLEAARRAGVKRVLLASSVQVVDRHVDDQTGTPVPLSPGVLPAPRYLYACTKVFLEVAGQVYAADHALDVTALRLGWCPRDARQEAELAALPVYHDLYLSPGDVGRFFVAAAHTPAAPGTFRTVYVTSRPRVNALFDLAPTTAWCGWTPAEQWPAGL